jgi:hypothetical protein
MRRREPEPDEEEQPEPFSWAEVEARLQRMLAVHRGEEAARVMWRPIEAALQEEQRKMREKGNL